MVYVFVQQSCSFTVVTHPQMSAAFASLPIHCGNQESVLCIAGVPHNHPRSSLVKRSIISQGQERDPGLHLLFPPPFRE